MISATYWPSQHILITTHGKISHSWLLRKSVEIVPGEIVALHLC